MKATKPLALHLFDKKWNGSFSKPAPVSIAFTGPVSANNAKNSIANADAMIRFGR